VAVECREVSQYLAESLGTPAGPAAGAVEAHLRSCPGCRADLESYRRLGVALPALAAHTVAPPPWLHAALVESVRAGAGRAPAWSRLGELARARQSLANPRYAAAGAGLLLAGLATGAVLVRGRRRRRSLGVLPTTAAA
jgi:anti-sigma factor RsiW